MAITYRIQKKIILNKKHPSHIEVAIGEIEAHGNQIHYILSFGGDKSVRIIGKRNWEAFLDMLKWLDWDPTITQELYIPALDNKSESPTHENTIPHIDVVKKGDTKPYELEDLLYGEIIDGIPIYDDEG